MRVIALVLCFASRTPPASNAAHSQLRFQLLLSPRALSSMPRDSRATWRDAVVPLADKHSLYAHIRFRTPAQLVRGARQLHRMRGHRRGQRSLVSARRRGQRALDHLNRTARRRQRPWLHDEAEVAPGRGLRGERLAERGGRVRGRVLASTHVTPSTRLVTQV